MDWLQKEIRSTASGCAGIIKRWGLWSACGGFGEIRKSAQDKYRDFVRAGKGQPSPWELLKNQIYLGSDEFVEEMQCKVDPEQSLDGIPLPQKMSPPKELVYYSEKYSVRSEAIAAAYRSGHYSLQQVGRHFGVSSATVSRAVKAYEGDVRCKT